MINNGEPNKPLVIHVGRLEVNKKLDFIKSCNGPCSSYVLRKRALYGDMKRYRCCTGYMPGRSEESCFPEFGLITEARPLLNHALEKLEFDQLADPRLMKNYVVPEMFQLIEAAAACVRHSAAKRPGMGQIMRAFDNSSDLTNGMKVGESTIYNCADESAEIRFFRRMAFGSPDFSSDFFSQGTQHRGESAENRVHKLKTLLKQMYMYYIKGTYVERYAFAFLAAYI